MTDLKLTDQPDQFICELKNITNGQDTITRRVPTEEMMLQGIEPPADFAEYGYVVGIVNNGQPVGHVPVNFNAPSPQEAFAMLPALRERVLKDLQKPKIQLAGGPIFNGHNRMNGQHP